MRYARLDRDSATVVRLDGQLDALTLHELTPLFEELAVGGQSVVVVDLSPVRLIDSAGIRCLRALFRRLRTRHAQARVVGMTGQPLALFELLRFESDMTVKPTPLNLAAVA